MFVVVVLSSVLLGLALGGKPSRLADLPIHGIGWIVASYFIRYCARFAAGRVETSPTLSILLSLACYGCLLLGIKANLQFPGMKAVALGTAMNLAVILANQGRMPVSLLRLSPDQALSEASRLSVSLTHQELLAGMKLTFLADLFRWSVPLSRVTVFSLGDVFLAIGAAFLVLTVMLRGFPPTRDDGRIG